MQPTHDESSGEFDVAIIGAGVVGSLIALTLARHQLTIGLLEKSNDVATGASKANSGIVHAGFDAQPGTLKARLNVRGASLMPQLCATLSVPYRQNGSLVLAFSPTQMATLEDLRQRGHTNGVDQLTILNHDEALALEPNLSHEVVGALLAKSAGIVCPYELTVAAAELACDNGVQLRRNCAVEAIARENDHFRLTTRRGEITAKYVINCAGVYADQVAAMIGDHSIDIHPRLGEYALLDKGIGATVSHTIFQCPTALGKGVLVSPTVDGNLIVGPTAVETHRRDSTALSQNALTDVFKAARQSVPSLGIRDTITSFGGLRAHDANSGDFVIGPSTCDKHFINVAGIESPGLASSPAIAEYVDDLFTSLYQGKLVDKPDYNPTRAKPARFRSMSPEQRAQLIERDPTYGRVICRCETITQGEITYSVRAPVGARDLDGVKRRTRAGMGRCQSGFCGSKVMEILSHELDMPINQVTKFGPGSTILFERTK